MAVETALSGGPAGATFGRSTHRTDTHYTGVPRASEQGCLPGISPGTLPTWGLPTVRSSNLTAHGPWLTGPGQKTSAQWSQSPSIENAARAVRGQVPAPGYPPPLGTSLPGYPAPVVPTSLGTYPTGSGTLGGRYLWGRPGVSVVRGAGRRSLSSILVPIHMTPHPYPCLHTPALCAS